MKKIILRADDLGYSDAVNCGIAKAVNRGLCKNVGIMTNMPEAKSGFEKIKDKNVCFGQHTNICLGKPICKPELIPSLVDKDGNFKKSSIYREAKNDFVVFDEVILEIEAQYKEFKKITKREPDYFEGHAVMSANFFKGLEYVANKYGLKYSGFPNSENIVKIGDTDVNVCFIKCMKDDYVPFDAFVEEINKSKEESTNLCVFHPGYIDQYLINNSSLVYARPKEVDFLCSYQLSMWLEENNITIIKYSDL